MDEFVKRLIAIQQEQKLFDGDMAEKIGCSRQLYQMTRTNQAPLGLVIIRGGLRAFPGDRELIKGAALWIRDGADAGKVKA